jgi:P27 family predicted phage terminase small subunit
MAGVKGQRSGGHNRKTRAEHEKAGTFRKDRHEDLVSPEAPIGTPAPPKPLDGEALEEWNRMIARLTTTGALSVVDDALLFQYCRLFAETEGIWLVQEETAETIRILQENLDGQQCRRPKDERLSLADLLAVAQEITKLRKLEAGYITKVRQGRMALRQLLVEFGLTPAARGRVKLPEKPKDADPLTALQKEKPGLVRIK